MTGDEKNAEIASVADERAELKRALICMDNKITRYRKALSQTSVALSRGLHLREDGDVVIVPGIDGLYDGENDRELPTSLSEIVALQKGRATAHAHLKELDQSLDDLGIVG